MAPIDIISEDGLLCLIISRLTLKEAVRTCVLSRRWRYIWTHLPELQFDPVNIFHAKKYSLLDPKEYTAEDHYVLGEEYAAEMRDKFIASVNSVLHQHPRMGVDTFSVDFYFHKIHSHHLDSWVDFAVESKTKSLALYLGTCSQTGWNKPQLYEFPCHMLGSSSFQILLLCFCVLKPHHEFEGFRHLRILCLSHVNVTEEGIRCLLSNCSTLQDLTVEECQELLTLSISHPLRQLTSLEVGWCEKLTKIEISAINLDFLAYSGPSVEFILRESSHLTKATIYFESYNMDYALTMLSNNLRCLEDLEFEINGNSEGDLSLVRNSSRFICLRHLTWQLPFTLQNSKGRLCLASLLCMSPFLKKLTLEYGFGKPPRELKQIDEKEASPHTHLKSVEFIGFTGDKWQLMFAVYILNSAIKLETMTLRRTGTDWDQEIRRKIFQTGKEYLIGRAPANVQLLFL